MTGFGDSAPNSFPVNADLCGIEYNEFLTIWIGFEENRPALPCQGEAMQASGEQPCSIIQIRYANEQIIFCNKV